MKKKKVIFVHGFGLSAPLEVGDWTEWLEQETTKSGFEFIFLSMPDVMFPEVDKWLEFLAKQNLVIDEDTYLVGHSLGCITIARYLEKLGSKMVAEACIFISGFCSLPKVPLLADFCNPPLDYSKVKKHAKEFIMIVSDNDHVILPSASAEFAQKLGARTIIEHNKGHFTSGVRKIPSVLNTILEIDQMKNEVREMKKLRRK